MTLLDSSNSFWEQHAPVARPACKSVSSRAQQFTTVPAQRSTILACFIEVDSTALYVLQPAGAKSTGLGPLLLAAWESLQYLDEFRI